MKLQAFSLQVFQKETPTQVLSCEVCKTFKDTYFEEYLQTTTSGGVLLFFQEFSWIFSASVSLARYLLQLQELASYARLAFLTSS